ncbi:MAG: class I tRNA ligase family protein, partial [Acidimicrobiales bacterium]
HSYRSHAAIEPWLSDQWYVAVTDDRLKGSALRAQSPEQISALPDGVEPAGSAAGDGGLRFFPERYARTYSSWHENIRDWCISRQLWWGHQIPVWNRVGSLADASTEVVAALAGVGVDEAQPVESSWIAAGAAHLARKITVDEIEESVCVPPAASLGRLGRSDDSLDEPALVEALEMAGYVRDPDVLDTWFSSGLWPMSTMGWPWPQDFPETAGLLEAFNPTSVLSTAREIITLWVSRMVMFNRYFLDGQLPFTDVFIHAMVQDGHGQKMSKSLGNGVDPRDIIHSHGADAMRFSLVQMTTDTQDVRMPVDMICPHTGEAFTPSVITTPAGHVVAAPFQDSRAGDGSQMLSNYGYATGAAEPTDEVPLARNTSSKFDNGRNFANKVWNATRFVLGILDEAPSVSEPVDMGNARFIDRWIVSRLAETTGALETALASYQFNVYADTLYHYVWDDFCDNYLEAIKPTVRDDPQQQAVLGATLDALLRLMHPVMPFITEELWPHVSAAQVGTIGGVDAAPSALLANAPWPTIDSGLIDVDVAETFSRANELLTQIRRLRAERLVKPKQQITIHIDGSIRSLIESVDGLVETLAGVGSVMSAAENSPTVSSSIAFEGSQVIVSDLVEEVDAAAEGQRLDRVIEDLTKRIANFEGRLANEGYVNNAKPELVEETRDQLAAAQADLTTATAAKASIT